MLTDTRIRLEGKLEVLEGAIAAWERAARVMRGTAWRPDLSLRFLDLRSASLRPALREARRMAESAPEVRGLLGRFERAQQRVRAGAIARLRALGITPPSTELTAVVEALRKELPIAHEGRLGWATLPTAVLGGALLLLAGVVAASRALLMIPALSTVAFLLLFHWLATKKVTVTQQRIVIGAESALLSDVVRVTVRVAALTNRRGKKCEIEVQTRGHRVIEAWTRATPTGMISALEAAGVPCDIEGGPLFFWW